MALTITHLSGPYAGREITIGDDLDLVTFGRDMNAVVGFPVELDSVSRDHFKLRRELGIYKFVIARDKPVFVNGRPLIDGEELDAITDVELSGPGGPRLRIVRADGATGNMPKTKVLARGQDIGDVVQAQRSGGRRLAVALGALAVAVAVVAGGVYLLREDVKTTQAGLAAVTSELPSMKDSITAANEAAASRMDTAAINARVHDSIYHVQVHFPGGSKQEGGTASVIQLPDGTKALATNAHVAEVFLDTKTDSGMAGAKLVVVQPVGPDYPVLEVTDVKIHPGYKLFEEWSSRVWREAYAMASNRFDPIPSYDVALMYVAEPEKLGPALTYAPVATIEALGQGEPLFTAGYPSEGLSGTDINRPEPTSHSGLVTAVTTFYFYRGKAEDNQLVQHSAPVAGGASGSPMFNAKGEVVALVNAINLAQVETQNGARVPSAALVNYAQRADLVFDLIDGTAETEIPRYKEEMAEAEARLKKTPEGFIADLKVMIGQFMENQAGVSEIGRLDVTMDQRIPDAPETMRVASVKIDMPEPGIYAVAAISLDQRVIQVLGLDANGQPVNYGLDVTDKSFFLIDNRDGKTPSQQVVVLDVGSLAAAPDSAGVATFVLLKAAPKGAGAGG